jgi:cytochrome c oxidase subunit IV
MSNRGKTRRNEIKLYLIIIITLFVLGIVFYYLIDYLRSILVSFVVYRLAIAFAILIGVITSIIFYYLGKRWLRLEVSEMIFVTTFALSMISVFTTLFFIDNIELAFQAAQIVATIFFGGLVIAVLMFINIKMNTQRTSPAEPPQANPPPQPSPVQLQTLSQTSLFPLPQPGQQVIVEIQGNRIVLTVQNNRQEVSAQT